MKSAPHLCPHCLGSFAWNQAPFRCDQQNPTCPTEEDEVHARFFGTAPGTLLPKITSPPKSFFTKPTKSVDCSGCGGAVKSRVCPHCHGDLPALLEDATFLPIALMAQDPAAPKVYVSALLRQLQVLIAHDLGATVRELEGLEGFCLEFEESRKKVVTVFYAMELEDILEPRAQKSLRHMGGFLILNSGKFLFEDTPLDENGVFFTQSLKALEELAMAGIQKPTGFVMTHFQDWAGTLPKASIFFQSGQNIKAYDQEDGRHVSTEVRAFVGARFGPNCLKVLRAHVPKFRFFIASTQLSGVQGIREGARVEDSYLWLLKENGYI